MKPPFFCAVDESQAVVLLLQWEYRTDDFRWSRPLPKELVRSWTTLLPSEHMHLALSGTGIDLHLFEESLNTPAFKECNFDLKSDFGAFEDAETQSEYVKRYVPADWLSGRPCSTGHGSGCVEGCCMISMLHRLCLQCDLDTEALPHWSLFYWKSDIYA